MIRQCLWCHTEFAVAGRYHGNYCDDCRPEIESDETEDDADAGE